MRTHGSGNGEKSGWKYPHSTPTPRKICNCPMNGMFVVLCRSIWEKSYEVNSENKAKLSQTLFSLGLAEPAIVEQNSCSRLKMDIVCRILLFLLTYYLYLRRRRPMRKDFLALFSLSLFWICKEIICFQLGKILFFTNKEQKKVQKLPVLLSISI